MKRPGIRIHTLFAAAVLAFAVLIQTFSAAALSERCYNKLFDRLEVFRTVGVTPERIREVGTEIVRYLDHRRPDLLIPVTADGSGAPVTAENGYFNAREIHHMEDVRRLFTYLKIANAVSLLTLLTTFGLYCRIAGHTRFARELWLASVLSVILSAAFALFLVTADFEPAFVRFHEIFFDNDLWILDPSTDRLIQMMPLDFFVRFVTGWAVRIGIGFALLLALTGGFYFFEKRTR